MGDININSNLESKDISVVDEAGGDNKKLSLKQYLSYCLDFMETPSDENQQKINDFLANIQVREYLPLVDKNMLAVDILRKVRGDFDAPGAAVTIEMGKLIDGLCSYALNLDIDIYPLESTYQVYDMCKIYGLYDAIYNSCKRDYDSFCVFVDSMNNMSNTYRLIQTASLFNDTDYQKWVDTLNEFKTTLTQENLQALLSVNIMNDPGIEVSEVLGKKALENANRILANEKITGEEIATRINNKFFGLKQTTVPVVDDDKTNETSDNIDNK